MSGEALIDWRKLFAVGIDQELEFFLPAEIEGSRVVKLSKEVKGLSFIASIVGKPLHMDSITAVREKLEYARVCVEIPAESLIHDHIDVVLSDESVARIRVSVPWMPSYCTDCGHFGHSNDQVGVDGDLVENNAAANSITYGDKGCNVILDVIKQAEQSSNPPIKRGRGRSTKEGKVDGGGLKNKFEILNSIDPDILLEISVVDSGKKQRGDSLGVAKLVQELKLKKKEHVDKVNKFKERGGVSSSSNISILYLLETRVKEINSIVILSEKFSDWQYCCNYSYAENGRIWVIWQNNVVCSISSTFDQIITLKGHFGGIEFFITVVYGLNDSSIRRHLWIQLSSVEGSSCVEDSGLFDHHYIGPLFTWTNKQHDTYLARKLDRVLVNPNWIEAFPSSDVEFLAPGDSDHCPTLVCLHKEAPANKPKPFKFFNFWAMHPDFMSIVKESWQAPVTANPIQTLYLKLKRLKISLKELNMSHYSDISGSINAELEAEKELKALEEAEMLFYKQKTKMDWIRDGDQGTRFFHSMVITKRKNNTMIVLYNQSGVRLDTFEDMSNEVIRFFVNQLGVVDPKVKGSNVSTIKDLLGFSLPRDASDSLCKDVSEAEIKEALWGQENNKSSGPYRYNAFFFKKAWSILGEDFLAAVRYCFDHSCMLISFNATAFVLVPKIPNPSLVKNFRPISCCTVVYKTVTKILVHRLSSVFPDMISMNETAFVKGRSIVDNTLLAQELVRGYSRRKISPRCALKIDLQKAFDSLNWEFIDVILYALGLPEKFIGWTWACFANFRYSIVFNGSLVGYFKAARGVRQGDPLSPYIFVLVMNVLPNLLNVAATKGVFSYHPKCKRICLTHLFC
ncbi:uncharacterized protein LOC120138287 [Hibiscus syriacus]|uniref:uncharacterized protein LOC120138287 n=1 Tax=Hibiscus syriacus TaxID=106335 RepID=UPI0019235C89|nr:uncharacterized protein LOC120138287 [Hibiscus syriacus]